MLWSRIWTTCPFQPEQAACCQTGLGSQAADPPATDESQAGPGIVAVAPGPGLAQVFKSLGAHSVVAGGLTMNPSTEELLRAIQTLPQHEVIVLPNSGNVIMTAQQAQALSGKPVAVVPSKTVPQGISALLALNTHRTLEANAEAMDTCCGRCGNWRGHHGSPGC